jgi:hypothetical protein
MGYRKKIEFKKVFYQRNIDLGLEVDCHECISHCKGKKNWYPTIMRNYKTYNVHRWVYFEKTGNLPEVVLHLCDNPKCININHLKAGTYKDNSIDMENKRRSKGTFEKGEKHPKAKLTEKQVIEIIKLIKQGLSNVNIAEKFNTKPYTISNIKRGTRWTHITNFGKKGVD